MQKYVQSVYSPKAAFLHHARTFPVGSGLHELEMSCSGQDGSARHHALCFQPQRDIRSLMFSARLGLPSMEQFFEGIPKGIAPWARLKSNDPAPLRAADQKVRNDGSLEAQFPGAIQVNHGRPTRRQQRDRFFSVASQKARCPPAANPIAINPTKIDIKARVRPCHLIGAGAYASNVPANLLHLLPDPSYSRFHEQTLRWSKPHKPDG
jgi:hypothetical protein